jgi:hypothetical protein
MPETFTLESREKDEFLKSFYKGALWHLKDEFEVENLNTIEAARLWDYVKGMAEKANREQKLVESGQMSQKAEINPTQEVAYMWLEGLYGIKREDVQYEYEVFDDANNEYLCTSIIQAKNKVAELIQSGLLTKRHSSAEGKRFAGLEMYSVI